MFILFKSPPSLLLSKLKLISCTKARAMADVSPAENVLQSRLNAKMRGANAIKMRGANCLHWMDKKPQTTASQEFYSWTWLQFAYPTEVLEYKVCFHVFSVEIVYIW